MLLEGLLGIEAWYLLPELTTVGAACSRCGGACSRLEEPFTPEMWPCCMPLPLCTNLVPAANNASLSASIFSCKLQKVSLSRDRQIKAAFETKTPRH